MLPLQYKRTGPFVGPPHRLYYLVWRAISLRVYSENLSIYKHSVLQNGPCVAVWHFMAVFVEILCCSVTHTGTYQLAPVSTSRAVPQGQAWSQQVLGHLALYSLPLCSTWLYVYRLTHRCSDWYCLAYNYSHNSV